MSDRFASLAAKDQCLYIFCAINNCLILENVRVDEWFKKLVFIIESYRHCDRNFKHCCNWHLKPDNHISFAIYVFKVLHHLFIICGLLISVHLKQVLSLNCNLYLSFFVVFICFCPMLIDVIWILPGMWVQLHLQIFNL